MTKTHQSLQCEIKKTLNVEMGVVYQVLHTNDHLMRFQGSITKGYSLLTKYHHFSQLVYFQGHLQPLQGLERWEQLATGLFLCGVSTCSLHMPLEQVECPYN